MISATYSLLGLMSFLTAGETEVRAWTIWIEMLRLHVELGKDTFAH